MIIGVKQAVACEDNLKKNSGLSWTRAHDIEIGLHCTARAGVVVGVLASHQCGLGSIPRLGVT